jgi:hypothetical protein
MKAESYEVPAEIRAEAMLEKVQKSLKGQV